MDEKRRAARWRKRRIIFNNDGNDVREAWTGVEHRHYAEEKLFIRSEAELIDDFLNARSRPLVGTQVDSIGYCTCMAGVTFSHHSKLGGFHGKGVPQELVEKYGRDNLRIQTDFCHENDMELFWSLRMNDAADSFPEGSRRWTFALDHFKREHPEYVMGEPEEWVEGPAHNEYWSWGYPFNRTKIIFMKYGSPSCWNTLSEIRRRISSLVRQRRGLPGLFGVAALARRLRLSEVRTRRRLAPERRASQMFGVWCAQFGDGGYDLRPDSDALDGMVHRVLAVRHRQGWDLGVELEAGT